MTPERWQQIEALYHAAHALPPDERAAFLARTCAGDDGLQREVERLLSQPGSDEGFLAGGAVALAGGLPAARVGQTLGGYHLEELIGVGGMGEVYRARDEKLGRHVAIKVLPPAFTSDAARLARFEREARTLAALNHPNICAIHGFEQADEVRFLVLELVEGGTLDDRLATSRRQPGSPGLPEREALHIARQIARALDFAHQRGIVHRDLKPANIKVGADGSVKVVDFGLAKAAAGDTPGDLAHAGSNRAAHTIEGTIVGTPAYMSPEQARGAPIDKRADVWAFGCVLYEMLTGRAAFSGGSVADTIAAVLQREPDWAALPASTPLPIRNLLLGCLAKDSQDRLRDIGDVRITIDSILSGSSVTTTTPTAAPAAARTASGSWVPWMLAAVVVVLAIAGITIWRGEPQPASDLRVMRSTIELQADQTFDRSGGAHVVTLSHDGTVLAYVASPHLLYLRPIANLEATPIPGTEAYKGVREPAFSPDDKKIAFYAFADRKLKWIKIPGSADAAVDVGQIETPTGIDWSERGILYGQGRNGIFLRSPNGEPPRQIARVEADEIAHGPQMLPDGDHFLFTIAKGSSRDRWDRAKIVVGSLTTKVVTNLPIAGSDGRFIAPGYLVYAVDGRIFAIRFDPARLEVQGTGEPVEDGVSRAGGGYTGAANFSVSNNGLLLYVPGPVSATQAPMDISLFDPVTGNSTKLKLPADQYDSIRIAPNGSQIAFVNARDKEWTIYASTISGTIAQRLTAAGSNNRFPTWTRDSLRVAFQSDREDNDGIWWQAVEGSGTAERLTTAKPGESHIPESWSANRTLLYSIVRDGVHSLATLSLSNGNWVSQPFGRSRSTDPMSGVFSPDGRLVAYTLTQRGETTTCVEPFPATSAPVCLPAANADSPKHPRWAPDGSRLYYDPRIGGFESIAVVTQPELSLVGPRPEPHPFRLAPMGERTPYDISVRGRFLGLTIPGTDGFALEAQISNKIIAVTNWGEILKQRVSK